jgi:hypothetical protein
MVAAIRPLREAGSNRQHKVLASLKGIRLRGPSGARESFHLAAIVQNVKTMALRLLGPPPQLAPARRRQWR